MRFLRHPALIALVGLAAIGGTTGAILSTRANFHPGRSDYFSAATVRSTFAKHGVRLTDASAAAPNVWLSRSKPPLSTSQLYVIVAAKNERMDWGAVAHSRTDTILGNLDVHYGGYDQKLAGAVHAATESLLLRNG